MLNQYKIYRSMNNKLTLTTWVGWEVDGEIGH